jgi:cytochrome c556
MKRMLCAASLAAVVLGLAAISSNAQGPKPEEETIKSIMKKLHAKDKGHVNVAKAAVAANPVDWEAVEKAAKPIEALGKAMGKLDPPKGDKEDYVKLCKDYTEKATALLTAAKDKKQPEAQKAVEALSKSCMKCHQGHK